MPSKYIIDDNHRICSICKEIKENKDFYIRKKTGKQRQECIECCRKEVKKWRNKNIDKIKNNRIEWGKNNKTKIQEYDKRKRAKNKQLLKSILQEHGCQICGEKDINVLQCHHIIKLTKEERLKNEYITTFISSKKKLLEELSKCCVLCKNCHIKVHHYNLVADLKNIDISKYK